MTRCIFPMAVVRADSVPSILCRVVFVVAAALRQRFDFQRVGLRTVGRGNQIVMRLLRAIVVRAPTIFSFC